MTEAASQSCSYIKRYFENMLQIYRTPTMPKCDFSNVIELQTFEMSSLQKQVKKMLLLNRLFAKIFIEVFAEVVAPATKEEVA